VTVFDASGSREMAAATAARFPCVPSPKVDPRREYMPVLKARDTRRV